MKIFSIGAVLVLGAVGAAVVLSGSKAPTAQQDWPQWRGPMATGEAPGATPPVFWDDDNNVAWKTPIAGRGLSSPVVSGGRVFLTTAVPVGDPLEATPERGPGGHDNLPITHRQRFVVMAIDADKGGILWEKEVLEAEPHAQGHHTASLASASPITDGERVYAFFGSNGLYALDMDGESVWSTDLGKMSTKHAHGEGSTPVLAEGVLVVNWDHEEQSWIAGLDAATGKETWWVPRDEGTSWATPVVTTVDGRSIVIVPGSTATRAYDLHSGDEIWEVTGLSKNIVASPVVGHGMVFAGSSYEIRSMVAVRLSGAEGSLDGTEHVAWRRNELTPYVPSPLLYRGTLYFLGHYQRTLSRVRAVSGKDAFPPTPLPTIRNVYASPVAAAGRVYITDQDGVTVVLDHASGEVVATNRLDDHISASAAVVGDTLYLRGESHLYALRKEAP